MSDGRILWFPELLARWSIPYAETDGWHERGRATLHPKGTVIHHDALTSAATAANATALMIRGRGQPDPLPGPLSNLWLDDDNDHTAATGDPVCYVIASGRANHAGRGGIRGLDTNDDVIGIEARSRGEWSDAMILTYMRVGAACCDGLGVDASWVFGHKEWAPGRKSDPANIDMAKFRGGVQFLLNAARGAEHPTIAAVDAAQQLLKLKELTFYSRQIVLGDGLENPPAAVSVLQARLAALMPARNIQQTGIWDGVTAQAVIDLQRWTNRNELGRVGPLTWSTLLD